MYIEKILEEINSNINTHNLINSDYSYDHMVYLRVFEGCNLHCEHCFIPSNPKKIHSDFFKNNGLTNELIENAHIKENSNLYIQWHGGEPTLLGVDYLENAIKEVQKDTRFKYMHGIQTNLMNFHQNTDKWVNLYKTYFDSQLGVSWDYAIRHTKSSAVQSSKTNEEFEFQFWKNIELALQNNLELYMVVTATKIFFEHFTNPFDFFEMLVEKGITKLNFERVTKTGYARESWDRIGLSNLQYSQYMSKFFKAYFLFKQNNPEINLHISPFDGLLRSVLNLSLTNQNELNDKANIWDILSYKNQGYGCWSGECDTRFHTIDSNGYKHGCTALTSEQDNKNKSLQQSVNVQKIVWIGKKTDDKALFNESQKNAILHERKNRQDSCAGCEFLKICSSGCLSVEKFDESGECSGAKTLFTTIKKQIVPYLNLSI